MMRPLAGAGLVVAALVVAGGLTGAAAPRPADICIPIPLIWECDDDDGATDPTPTPTDTSLLPDVTVPEADDAATPTPTATPAPTPTDSSSVEATPDDGAPVFTQPPAQLGSDSLSFTGLSGVELVTVPLADGSRVPALKISADSITITGFALTVQGWTGAALATTADTMTLRGHVEVYLDSLTATTQSGGSFTLGSDTPPPADGIEPMLLRVTFGLVGATADSISYTNTDQRLSE
ncbi:MAG: hypothetical protein QM626_12535 [Microbacterium sp.]|uniref:hypothetical protein n=1 Tax=Microbacterium sp. TaxID=51671 RepID=UPI0039E410C7